MRSCTSRACTSMVIKATSLLRSILGCSRWPTATQEKLPYNACWHVLGTDLLIHASPKCPNALPTLLRKISKDYLSTVLGQWLSDHFAQLADVLALRSFQHPADFAVQANVPRWTEPTRPLGLVQIETSTFIHICFDCICLFTICGASLYTLYYLCNLMWSSRSVEQHTRKRPESVLLTFLHFGKCSRAICRPGNLPRSNPHCI